LREKGVELIESKIAPGAWRIKRQAWRRENTGGDAGDPQSELSAIQQDAGKSQQKPAMPALQQLSADGFIYFQDEASQLVAHLVGAHSDDRILDACAAPGSKSTLIAALAPQARIVAGDLYEHRARTINEVAKLQRTDNIGVVVYDATRDLPFENQNFDRVLVDAPCSGTGTLRQNPEIRWRLQANDIKAMAEKQELILKNAASKVRAGGVLVYSTCSLEPDENEAVIANFVAQHSDFKILPLDGPHHSLTAAAAIRTWPHRDDVEGFFVAALRKN
jgi:16S rRNA (cytosine967-C5)-methyltransferase